MWVVVQTTVHVFRSLYSYRFPLPETETFLICQRPLTWRLQLSAIVKLSSLIWTGADLQNQGLLGWSTGIRTQNDRTKTCSVTITPCFNKTSIKIVWARKYNLLNCASLPIILQFATEDYATLCPSKVSVSLVSVEYLFTRLLLFLLSTDWNLLAINGTVFLIPLFQMQAQIVATDVVSQIKVWDQPAYINLLLQKLARRRMLAGIPLWL